jgi:hypothetical protein
MYFVFIFLYYMYTAMRVVDSAKKYFMLFFLKIIIVLIIQMQIKKNSQKNIKNWQQTPNNRILTIGN